MKRFFEKEDKDADLKYVNWCLESPKGYIFNYFKGNNLEMNVIHKVNCKKLDMKGKRTSVEKVCSNKLNELVEFANHEQGINNWIYCSNCFPNNGTSINEPNKMFKRIILERTMCYGDCPAYKVEVLQTGEVLWDGFSYVSQKGKQKWVII